MDRIKQVAGGSRAAVAAALVAEVAELTRPKELHERRSACRSCGKATEPGDGIQTYAEHVCRDAKCTKPEVAASWKCCASCVAGQAEVTWLGAGRWDEAVSLVAAEYAPPRAAVLSPDGTTLWRRKRVVGPGPVPYEEAGGKPEDQGAAVPWTHAPHGRAEARARLVELRRAGGVPHGSGGACGCCGRTRAWPALQEPLQRRGNGALPVDTAVRWGPVSVFLVERRRTPLCTVCYAQYRRGDWPMGPAYTLEDWAASSAAGLKLPMPGLAEQIGFRLAATYPVERGARGPWEYLGADLVRLRAWVAERPATRPQEDRHLAGLRLR